MAEWLVPGVILAFTGVCAGFLAGLFGVGGGLVIVPALFFLLKGLGLSAEVAMAMAVNTSLAAIIPTSLSSLRAHHRLANVDWSIVKVWCLPMVLGVGLGALMVAKIRSPLFIVLFGVLLLAVAAQKLFYVGRHRERVPLPKIWLQALAASTIGWLSACVGVGGGATGVPTLVAMGLPIHRAVGTCAALGLCIALPGSIAIFALSQTPPSAPLGTFHLVYFPALVLLTPLTVFCAPLGAKFGKRLPAELLTRLFALVLVLVGARMIYSVF